MINIVGGVSVLLAATSLAGAADLPFKAPAPAPFVPSAYYDWTGCYIGANLGRVFSNARDTLNVFGMPAAGNAAFNGGVAGGQIGCNFQSGNFVYGIEGDGQVRIPVTQFGTAITQLGAVTSTMPASGTLRARLGYAPVNNVLVYVTAGGGAGYQATALTQGTLANPITQVNQQIRAIWTVGAGVETAIYRNWTAKFEYLYSATGTNTANFNINGIPSTTTTRFNDNLVRVGVNYRF
jgi:outer membrane immunogenic protein